MSNSTYSFLDMTGAIAAPTGAKYIFTGEGIGEGGITVAMDSDRTTHDVGSDGSVMVSKMAGNNGTVTISVQQTSPLHKWLLNTYQALLLLDTSMWAATSIWMRNVYDGTSHVCTGVSFLKVPDLNYQRQGQNLQWVLKAADIISVGF
jgi:hypothetical protein